MSAAPLLPGTRVRFTSDHLGLIRAAGDVNNGDLGTVLGPAPEDGWWFVEPDKYPQTICPVPPSMFEVIS